MKNWHSKKIYFAMVAVTLACSVRALPCDAADYYFGNFDDFATYNLINNYTDPTRTGWFDFAGLQTTANTSTTIGVVTGTQSLAWVPSTAGYTNGLTYKVQIDPRPLAERDAYMQGLLANTHLAMNITWDRTEWVAQHNGDINSQNYSQVRLVYNFGPGGANNFSSALAPAIDTGNANFPGGWDPVNYTTPTHNRIVMFDYTPLKAQLQALYDSAAMNGQNGFLEFILVTNAATGDPGYSWPITYYTDGWRFTTPLPGDFNNSGGVDAADYVTWRANEGANVALPNDNGVGNQAARYTLWRGAFGNPPAGSGLSGGEVPEPTAWMLAIVAMGLFGVRRSSR